MYKGPTPRSHAFDLPKKVRALGLKHALSAKVAAGELVIVDDLNLTDAKTSAVAKAVKENGWKRVLVIDGAEVNENFARAARNLHTRGSRTGGAAVKRNQPAGRPRSGDP